MSLVDKFLESYKNLEAELKAEGMTILDYENKMKEGTEKERLKVCRIMRNYMSHNDTVFLDATNEQIKFIDGLTLGIRRQAHTVKDEMKKVTPVKETEQLKNMLVSIDKERSFSEKQGVKIEGYRFNFNRLFNGRVVRSKDDYLRIRTDAKGLLRDARIALQDLKESSEIVKTDEDINENETTLDSLVSVELDAIQVIDQNGNEKKERVDKVEVNSVAEAYCEIFVGESKMYFPCLSYASKINLSNDEKISYIIDAPHSRQSWGDYNHEKKGTARFNRRDR